MVEPHLTAAREQVDFILSRLDSHTIRGQRDTVLTARLRLQLDASTSRQERNLTNPLWQTSLGVGLSVRF